MKSIKLDANVNPTSYRWISWMEGKGEFQLHIYCRAHVWRAMLVPLTFICAVTNSVFKQRAATREKHTSISHADRNDDGDDDDMITVRKAFKAFISRVRVSKCVYHTMHPHYTIT